MSKNPKKYRHIWVYDDSAMLGPLATIDDVDGKEVMIFSELQKTNRGLLLATMKKGGFIVIKRDVWDAIEAWASSGAFGGLELHDYLNRMFGAKI